MKTCSGGGPGGFFTIRGGAFFSNAGVVCGLGVDGASFGGGSLLTLSAANLSTKWLVSMIKEQFESRPELVKLEMLVLCITTWSYSCIHQLSNRSISYSCIHEFSNPSVMMNTLLLFFDLAVSLWH